MSTGFHHLKVIEVRRETEDAISLRLDASQASAGYFRFTAGQHLTLRTEIDGEDVRRNYSICAAPHEDELRIAIKRIEGGRFSNWANQAIAVGDMLEAMPPHGSFTWHFDPSRASTYVGIAAGSGITPVLSLLKAALAEEPNSEFILLFGNRASNSIMFLEELAGLKDRYLHRLQIYHFLTAESDDVDLFNGRIDAERVARVMETLVDPAVISAAFICGPAAMMDAAEQGMKTAGVATDRIFVERFTADRPTAAQEQADRALTESAEGLQIQVTIDGRRSIVAFHADKGSILENARAAGLAAPFACKAGVCATCRAKLISGDVKMKANYGLSADELTQGYILTCQAIPIGDGVVLDYDG